MYVPELNDQTFSFAVNNAGRSVFSIFEFVSMELMKKCLKLIIFAQSD